jgi:beta-mannanase
MRSGFARPLTLVLAVLLFLATTAIPGLAREAQAASTEATTYSLLLSRASNRSNAAFLQGLIVSGNIYVFVSPDTGIKQVRFYLDNTSASGTPTQTENLGPYDFAGGAADAASPYDTKKLSNGSHTITAAIDLSTGGTTRITSAFTVANYSLMLSKSSSRSSAVALGGQTVSGNIYVFVSPDTGIKQVRFYLDNASASGTPTQTENSGPYDFAGGAVDAATPYDTKKLSNGSHTLTAAIDLSTGGTTKFTSSFTVNNSTVSPTGSIYWGINMDGAPWDITKVSSWEQNVTGKAASIIHWGHSWDSSGGYRPWASAPANNARGHGSIPMISWNPQGGDQTRWQLRRITNGEHDAYIRQFATDLKNWGNPVFIRLMHEMNGNWGFPWQEDSNGNQRGEFVPAWQHIVNIFKSVGATNVSWVWCPNVDYSGSPHQSFSSLYPGDSYVDWTCLDGYNWGTTGTWGSTWDSFDTVYNWSYNEIAKFAPSKPMMIGEFGSVEQGGSKAAWFTDVLGTQLPSRYPRMRAVVYFNWAAGTQDWRIETTTAAADAWRKGISSSYYYANQFGSITGKISVP